MNYEDLKALAGKACIDIYLSLHVSEMGDKPEEIKRAWSTGQELYLLTTQNPPKPKPPEVLSHAPQTTKY